MKRILITFAIFTFSVTGFAQLGTPMSQYSGNQLAYNPGYAGVYDLLAVNLTVHKSWLQLPGSPMMINLNGHAPFKDDKHAWGWAYQMDQWGPLTGNFGYGNYAYKMYFNHSVLNLGIQAGFFNHTVNWNKIDYIDDHTDPGLGEGCTGTTRFDVNVGGYYLAPNWYIGLSAMHLTNPAYDVVTIGNKDWYSQMSMQFFLIGGYNFEINESWSARPELFLRYVKTTPLSANAGLHLHYQNRYSIGVNFMSGQKAVSFCAKIMLNEQFRIGYSYGVFYGDIKPYQRGAHEVSINYYIKDLWKMSRTVDLLWL